ncbi:hypothetical protein KB206_18830 [Microvirga sp. STS02]|uniref:DUF6896 domain-containing protein n=1 Tax=Hymenobacter negativus TaxID=2795026 RepID=UPI0018DD06A4|nr:MULTISPECIES: hypothetical protein [Bacteria]MBH8570954.1 hypothetical protein [Hymenobacter negativus]MBR7210692.1 hypothetical protein [Microvirga sp. STS02]
MTMDLEKILRQYVSDIVSVVNIMKEEGFRRNPIETWQQTLYKNGEIAGANLKYDFHGMGCWVKWRGRVIDFDFRGDVANTIFGIDAWFAAYYLQSMKLDGYSDFGFCHKQILNTIEKLNQEGELVQKENVYFYLQDYNKLEELENLID